MQRKSLEIWVGIFLLLGIAALVMLAVQVSSAGSNSGDSYRISTRFENVGGLNEKAPVMIGGVRIGRVAEIGIDKDTFEAIVHMDISSHYDNLPIDTGATILTAGLLGSQFVGLEPGAEDIYLENNDEMDAELSQSAIQLETLISQFMFSQGRGGENDNESDN